MSHYPLLIIGDDPEGQLQPFSEHIEVEPWVPFTFEQKQKERRETIRKCEELLKDPSPGGDPARIRHLLKHLRSQSDRQYYQDRANDYELRNERGEPLTTANPDGRWDWYELGGRWGGSLKLKAGRRGLAGVGNHLRHLTSRGPRCRPGFTDQAKFKDIDWESPEMRALVPFACLKHGTWHAQGEMGWFGVPYDAKSDADWERDYRALLADVSGDTLVSLYDCHC